MRKWEYKIVTVNPGFCVGEYEAKYRKIDESMLGALGEEGWELVTVYGEPGRTPIASAYLKRPIG